MLSGRRKRSAGRVARKRAFETRGRAEHDQTAAGPTKVTPEETARLLGDEGAWERIGCELRRCDLERYVALLKIAEEICSIHRDPLAPPIPSTYLMLARRTDGQFD